MAHLAPLLHTAQAERVDLRRMKPPQPEARPTASRVSVEGSGTGATSARLVPRRISSTLRSGASYLFTADQVDQIRSALAAGRRRISLMPTDVQQQL